MLDQRRSECFFSGLLSSARASFSQALSSPGFLLAASCAVFGAGFDRAWTALAVGFGAFLEAVFTDGFYLRDGLGRGLHGFSRRLGVAAAFSPLRAWLLRLGRLRLPFSRKRHTRTRRLAFDHNLACAADAACSGDRSAAACTTASGLQLSRPGEPSWRLPVHGAPESAEVEVEAARREQETS